MKITGNEPAQPLHPDNYFSDRQGLTIRQEFAARFMAAMMTDEGNCPSEKYLREKARAAIAAADAIINVLNESEK